MGISYGGQRIIPSPFLDLRKSYATSQDGTPVGSTFTITLQGTLLPTKGSPGSTGTFWSASGSPSDESIDSEGWMQSLIRKKEALRQLFSWEGSGFRVDGFDGYSYMTANPRVKSLSFPAGQTVSWASQMKYTVELEADTIYLAAGSGVIEDRGLVSGYKIETAEENWNIEPLDEDIGTFKLTHQVNAKGKRHYTQDGNVIPSWQNAREYVISKLGLNQDRIYASGVLNLSGASGYNYMRAQRQSDLGGTFDVTETWVCFTPGANSYHAYEQFDVNSRADESGLTTVSIQGRVQGLDIRSNQNWGAIQSPKYYNASGKFQAILSDFHNRCQIYGGVALNSTPISQTVGHNQINGLINYTTEYNNRPSASISGAKSEKISINYGNQTDIWAEIAVLGRAAGPVLQDLGTVTAKTKTVNLEAVLGAKTQAFTPTQPDTNSLVSGYVPSATWVQKIQDQESWDENRGSYTRTIGWKYGS